MIERARIEYEGIVQGVGFRPFLHQLAARLGLPGWVLNTSAGVLLELEGERGVLEDYLARVQQEAPPLSRILVARVRWLPAVGFSGFAIRPSQRLEGELTLLCPDVAWVPDGVRDRPDEASRAAIHALFRDALAAAGARFVEIRGPWAERRRQAVDAVTSSFPSSAPARRSSRRGRRRTP